MGIPCYKKGGLVVLKGGKRKSVEKEMGREEVKEEIRGKEG